MKREMPVSRSLSFLLVAFGLACLPGAQADNLAGTTILIIRHAEKPASGPDLSEAGYKRAANYVRYFQPFKSGGQATTLDYLIATKASNSSNRPIETLEPLRNATSLPENAAFADDQFAELSDWLRNNPHGKNTLICWHHGKIHKLIKELGGHPKRVLGTDGWPDDVFNWVIELRFDDKGNMIDEEKIVEPF